MFNHIYERQFDFQKRFFNPTDLKAEDRIKWTKEFILCAHQELAEVMNSIDWKSYHLYDKDYDVSETKEEIIDVLKFVLNLAIVWGMQPNEIYDIFNKKTDETINRLNQKNELY